jgi:uncharacterized protein YjiK
MNFLKFRVRFLSPALLLTFGLIITAMGCRQKKRVLKSPPHYNFSDYGVFKLDLRLKEISGLAWDNKKEEFAAHNDESGKLFFLNKDDKSIRVIYPFAGKGDYEDIALVNGVPYILRSDGMITKFMLDSTGKSYGIEMEKIGLSGTNDFESMYYDPDRKALVILCKNCDLDDKKSVSAFAFYPDSTGFDDKPLYTIDAAEVEKIAPRKTSKFQPSAAAIHPVLKKLFILSSASNQLVIADLDGNVELAYVLSPKLFSQPEGIAFKNNGEMNISNEAISGKATILRFKYNL